MFDIRFWQVLNTASSHFHTGMVVRCNGAAWFPTPKKLRCESEDKVYKEEGDLPDCTLNFILDVK